MGRLDGKVAIVTGSTSGIGLGTAKIFAKEGAKVIVCGRRKETGEKVVEEIKNEGGEATYLFLDLTKPETIEQLFADTKAKYGKIDVLINNASNVGLPDGAVEELTLEMWDDIFNTDLRGTFFMIKTLLPYLKENGGSIVNIGSMASCGGDLGATAYASAKAGVDMLTKSVALQYGKLGIRCNCVRPGLIVTPQNQNKVPDVLKNIFLNNICVPRYGQPSDIANMCLYLASDESAFVTGQILTVDGGMNSHVSTVGEFKSLGGRTW
ncbi:MAG: SDR family NAD(P)-dependent oxidoreductase [bacterium]|nr:SDR family NAD(P)-dependent oxidoreductase [bacterium]